MKTIIIAATVMFVAMGGVRSASAADAKHAAKKAKPAAKPAAAEPAPAPLPAIPQKPAPAPQPAPSSDEDRGGKVYSTGR